jgi:UrcA family protein
MNDRNAFRPAALFGAALVATLLSSACCAGERTDGTPIVTVRYTQNELASTDGASNVYARIRNAARTVCETSGRSLAEQRAASGCFRDAVAAAVANVHSPVLESVYREHEQGTSYTAMLVR